MKTFTRGIVRLASYLTAGTSLFATPLCPQIAPENQPIWIDLISNTDTRFGSPGTSLLFSDLNPAPRTSGQTLPYTVEMPPSAIGAFDTHTFPAGPVFYSNSSGASVNCLPGIGASEPNGCPNGQVGENCPASGDCTGKPIQRTPATGILSTYSTHMAGFSYLGTFDGSASVGSGNLYQVIFFHQTPEYLAGDEYGFIRDLSNPNVIAVYWQTHANCTLPFAQGPNDTMCTTREADREPATYIYTDGLIPGGPAPDFTPQCNIDLSTVGGFGRYYYSMWIYSDNGTLKFGMSVRDPNTMQPVVPDTSIDPNAGVSPPWFPIGPLYGGSGYVTAGITRYDPMTDQTFSSPPPSMSIERLEVTKVAPTLPRRR